MHKSISSHESAKRPGLSRALLRVALAAGLAVSAAGCKETNAGVRITEPPRAPAQVGMDKVINGVVLIKTPNGVDLNTKKTRESIDGSGLVVSAGEAGNVILTARHLATTACRDQQIVMAGPGGTVTTTWPRKETPRKPTEVPQPGEDQAVITTKADLNSVEATPAGSKLKLGDSVYLLGYGTHYGEDGNAGGDPRKGDKPTLIPTIVVDVNNKSREAVVLMGFETQFNGPTDLHAEPGDSGGPALMQLSDGSYGYVGVVSQSSSAQPEKTFSLEEIARRVPLDDVKLDLPAGKYGVAIIDLVGGPEEIQALASQAKPCA